MVCAVAVVAAQLPLLTLGLMTSAHASASDAPSYTVFELPSIGASDFVGQTSGLVYTNNQELQVSDATDSVTQLSVPSDSSYWTDGGLFQAADMNSSGAFAGSIVSGSDAGEGAVWINGVVTIVSPLPSIPSVTGLAGGLSSTFSFQATSFNGESDPLNVINDEGWAGGEEYFSCTSLLDRGAQHVGTSTCAFPHSARVAESSPAAALAVADG